MDEAVKRFEEWCLQHGLSGRERSHDEWVALVNRHMVELNFVKAFNEAIRPSGTSQPILTETQANEAITLFSRVWENTPQNDRGGRTALELAGVR